MQETVSDICANGSMKLLFHGSMNNEQISMSAPTGRLIRLGDGAFISVVMNGENLTVRASDSQANFDKALEAYKNQDWDALYEAMRPVKKFALQVDGVDVTDNGVFFDGKPIHNAIATRILDFAVNGLDHKPLCNFLNKLMQNPSRRAVNELYTFLEHQNLPITDNGNFLAYKGLNKDYYSITSGSASLIQGKASNGRIYNGIGEVIEMRRNDVDDDKEVGCSYGLHAGTMEYARDFAQGKCVIVEINPVDVVSIPIDCSYQKLRTCKYKVVGEFEAPLYEPCYESRWDDEFDEDYDNSDCDCDCDCGCDGDNCMADCGDDCCQNSALNNGVDDTEDFLTPNSEWIERVVYDYVLYTITLYLHDGTTISHYVDDYTIFNDFYMWVEEGKSAGKFYHAYIKNKFDRLDD
ncbi:MAG: hypothetical protein EBU66_16435 [Bacteroidetes bacterium]|nr:hypothetical protein [Bacteroidota bacterium]